MECGCRLEIESSGTHLSCWAQMHCSPPRCVTHSYCTTHTSALARIHIRTRAQTNAVTLALPPPPLPSLPPSLCNVGQWWAQTPVRADNCLPDDATERRQGAMVKGTTPVPCVQQHQPLTYAERQHTTKGLFLTDTSRFLSARTCRANTHSRSASEANVCTCGRPRLYLLLLMRWLSLNRGRAPRWQEGRDSRAALPVSSPYQLLRTKLQPAELWNKPGRGERFCRFNPDRLLHW